MSLYFNRFAAYPPSIVALSCVAIAADIIGNREYIKCIEMECITTIECIKSLHWAYFEFRTLQYQNVDIEDYVEFHMDTTLLLDTFLLPIKEMDIKLESISHGYSIEYMLKIIPSNVKKV
jgi:hypothetical protein